MHFGFIRTYVRAMALRLPSQYLRQWFLYRQHCIGIGYHPNLSE